MYCWSLSENLTFVSKFFGLIYRRYFVVDVVLGSALGSCTFVVDFAVETKSVELGPCLDLSNFGLDYTSLFVGIVVTFFFNTRFCCALFC